MKGYLAYSSRNHKYQLRTGVEDYEDLKCGYPVAVKIGSRWIKGSLEMNSKKEYYLLSDDRKIEISEGMEAKLLW